jgi:biotin carboxyl carrier protein
MNLERIEAILRLLQRQEHAGALTVEGDGWRLSARRGRGFPIAPGIELPPEPPETENRHVVRAGVVGVYRAPEAALSPGDFVRRGASLGSIDSMRIPNPLFADDSGYVLEARVEDGDPVEYGQELFVLTTDMPPGETGQ